MDTIQLQAFHCLQKLHLLWKVFLPGLGLSQPCRQAAPQILRHLVQHRAQHPLHKGVAGTRQRTTKMGPSPPPFVSLYFQPSAVSPPPPWASFGACWAPTPRLPQKRLQEGWPGAATSEKGQLACPSQCHVSRS